MEYEPKIVMAALELCGTPWHMGGRLPAVGLDCVGIIVCSAKKAGIPVADFNGYGHWPGFELATSHAERILNPIKVDDVSPGDVLLFKLPAKGGQSIGHFAIYIGAGRFVHVGADRPRKVAVQGMTKQWENRINSAYRIPRRAI